MSNARIGGTGKQLNKRLAGLVVAIANKKGGVGKTTLATILAHRMGATLIDLDPQANAADWAKGCDHPHYRMGAYRITDSEMTKLVETVELAGQGGPVVLDCPPGENGLFRVALTLADGVIIPYKPGAADYKAVMETSELIRVEVFEANPDLKVMVLLNEARTQDSQGLTGFTVMGLKQNLPNARYIGSIGNRKVYPIAYSESTVPSTSKTDEELEVVFGNISKTLGIRI